MYAVTVAIVVALCFTLASTQTIRAAARHTGVYAGAIRAYGASQEPNYNRVLNSEYDLITAENECKWGSIHPSQNNYDFTQCDYIAQQAASNTQAFRGHNLCWGQYNPNWLSSVPQSQLASVLQNHIETVVKHYVGKVIAWDVVNEAVADNPSPQQPLKSTVWYPAVPNYIDIAFKAAKNADPNVPLFYNDYGAEGLGAKSDAVYNLVKDMKSRGIPIDGVGLQMHVSTSYCPSYNDIVTNIKRIGALGLIVHITEMDVSCPNPCNQQQQAQIYARVLQACLDNRNICKSFQTWGFTDLHTWLNTDHHPLPFDENYNKKPAYNTILANFTNN